MSNANQRLSALESQLSDQFGFKVELTVRNLRSFTVSTFSIVSNLEKLVSDFFGSAATVTGCTHDEECDGSFCYFSA